MRSARPVVGLLSPMPSAILHHRSGHMRGMLRGLVISVSAVGVLGAAEGGDTAFVRGLLLGAVPGLVLAALGVWGWLRARRPGVAAPSPAVPTPGRASTPPAVAKRRRQEASERTTEVLIRQGLPAARLGGW